MAIAYNWTCSACGVTNAAGTDQCHACGHSAVTSAAEIERQRGISDRAASEDQANSEGDPNAAAKFAVSIVIILAGMACLLTYDWPSGKQVSVADFVMYWFRELLILGLVLVVLVVVAFQKLRAKLRPSSEGQDGGAKRHGT